ncbi:PaaD-like zinc ribbon domain-containing protein [Thermogemmatispora tikiterensis]|nr:hypothetical protein [Thermogemmatispora tikiterensis]
MDRMSLAGGLHRDPDCPWCGSQRVRCLAVFGQSLLSSTWYCTDCRSTFERVRWGSDPGILSGAGPSPGWPPQPEEQAPPANKP